MVLFTLNLIVVILPIAGILVLRIYESSLIRQTESALASQAAFITSLYRMEVRRMRLTSADISPHSAPLPPEYHDFYDRSLTEWRPHIAALDLQTDRVLPRLSALKISEISPAAAKKTPVRWQKQIGRLLQPVLLDAQTSTLSAMRLLDVNANTIATTGSETRLNYGNFAEVREALGGTTAAKLRVRAIEQRMPLNSISRNASVRVYFAAPVVLDRRILGVVFLWRTPPDIFQALYGKRYVLVWSLLTLLGLILLISLFTGYTIKRPVRAVEQQARAAARGRECGFKMIEHPTTREVANLSREVAAMAQTLDERASYLRDLSARISHEFKSPLTALNGSIELMQDTPDMKADARKRFLDNMKSDVTRLSSLVSRLMELARADNSPQITVPDGGTALLTTLCRTFAGLETERGRTVIFNQAGTGDLEYRVSCETLGSILTNLTDNAFQHGQASSVTLSASLDRTDLLLEVCDDGTGISENNADRVLDPFFTTARGSGGTGLGLSVVSALVRALGGRFELTRNTPTGTKAIIRLPLKP